MKHKWILEAAPVWGEAGRSLYWSRCKRCRAWRVERWLQPAMYFTPGGEALDKCPKCSPRQRTSLDIVRCYQCGRPCARYLCNHCGFSIELVPMRSPAELLDPNCDVKDGPSGKWLRTVLQQLHKSGVITIHEEIKP